MEKLDLRNVEYENLIDILFRNEIRPANSILINFNEPDIYLFFKILCDLLTKGLLILLGREPILKPGAININEINLMHMSMIKDYFLSIGINIELTVINYEDIKNYNEGLIELEESIENKLLPHSETNSDKIEDYNFILKGFDKWYVINFKL